MAVSEQQNGQDKDATTNSAQAGEANTAEPTAESDNRLQVRVRSPDGNEVFFRIKKTTQMSKLMSAYCQRLGQVRNRLR